MAVVLFTEFVEDDLKHQIMKLEQCINEEKPGF